MRNLIDSLRLMQILKKFL